MSHVPPEGSTNLTSHSPDIVVIGAGPTGLGAAWRLEELGHQRWRLFEAAPGPGGLASSVVDEHGFTWDHGVHVFHSHYRYVDALIEAALGDDWIEHQRDAWVWLRQSWIPYPLQNNIWRLPAEDIARCIDDLLETALTNNSRQPGNFDEWLRASFGQGLYKLFMQPYNLKVWAYPPDRLDIGWVKDRVARVDIRRVLRNAVLRNDDSDWGPNARFLYPLRGGTGAIWQGLASQLPGERMTFGRRVVSIRTRDRKVILDSGEEVAYDFLISSIPLDRFLSSISDAPELGALAGAFVRTSTHVIGLGLQGATPPEARGKSWIYFPEIAMPIHRVSVHSNYSPYNVPRPGRQWSLLAEVGESAMRPVDGSQVVEAALSDLQRCGLIPEETPVVSRWHRRLEYGYPTPWLGRDDVLGNVNDALERRGILSRGRFGAWKYEVSNQDHCVMQGAEAVERILRGGTEFTYRGEMRDSLELLSRR